MKYTMKKKIKSEEFQIYVEIKLCQDGLCLARTNIYIFFLQSREKLIIKARLCDFMRRNLDSYNMLDDTLYVIVF